MTGSEKRVLVSQKSKLRYMCLESITKENEDFFVNPVFAGKGLPNLPLFPHQISSFK